MSALALTHDSLFEAVAAGHNTWDRLVTYFDVLPTSPTLRNYLTALVAAGRLREDGDHYHTIGHDLMENLEEQ